MPVAELSYRRLCRLAGGCTRRQASGALPFLGLDIESEDGDAVRVEYSPNRPDYSTEYGIALGLQGLLGTASGAVVPEVGGSGGYAIRAGPGVPAARPSVTAIAALGGRVDDHMLRQLMSMQEDLHAGPGRGRVKSSIGLHDIDRLSFPLAYGTAGRDLAFVPLGSEEEMTVREVLEGTETGRRYAHLLAGRAQVPVVTDAAGRTVSLPPVINAAGTAVTTRTRGLLVEVTGTGRREVEDVLAVVALTLQAAGFALERVAVSGAGNSTPRLGSRRMSVSPSLVNRTLGLDLERQEIVSCLERSRLGASVSGGRIACIIPPHRFDMLGPMDVVEEAALGYGIERLEPVLDGAHAPGRALSPVRRLGMLDSAMTGLGYSEALSPCLAGRRVLYGMSGRPESGVLSVADSKSGEHTVLRDSLLPGLLASLARNVHEPYPQRLYETGAVFFPGRPVLERTSLAAVCAHRGAGFTEAKSVLESALEAAFGARLRTRASSHPTFEEGRCADIVIGGRTAGTVGEVGRGVLGGHRMRVPVAGFEVSLAGLAD